MIINIRIILLLCGALGLLITQSACNPPKAEASVGAACDKNDTKLAVNAHNAQFPKQMDKCASSAFGNAEKTTKCLKQHYKALSDSCASCFGKMASCSASNCKAKCLFNHFSDSCLKCVNINCKENNNKNSFSLIKCTGLPENELPPSK